MKKPKPTSKVIVEAMEKLDLILGIAFPPSLKHRKNEEIRKHFLDTIHKVSESIEGNLHKEKKPL